MNKKSGILAICALALTGILLAQTPASSKVSTSLSDAQLMNIVGGEGEGGGGGQPETKCSVITCQANSNPAGGARCETELLDATKQGRNEANCNSGNIYVKTACKADGKRNKTCVKDGEQLPCAGTAPNTGNGYCSPYTYYDCSWNGTKCVNGSLKNGACAEECTR